MRRHVLASWHNPLGLIHMAAIFFRETEKALFYHPRPRSEKLGSEARRVKKVTLVSRVKKAAVWQRPMKVSCGRKQHWGLVWSLLSCKWVVLFRSPLIGSVGEQWFRKAEVIGNGRKSSEKFGSRKSSEHKERTFELLLYDSKSELIYVYEGWGWHMWERKGPPAQGAGANQNACVVPKIEKRM